MRREHLVAQDAVIIRGILDLMEREAEPVTSHLVEMTQHIGPDQANRLLRVLQKAGVIERPETTRMVSEGPDKRYPVWGWQLTAAARRGEIPGAEELARGMRT